MTWSLDTNCRLRIAKGRCPAVTLGRYMKALSLVSAVALGCVSPCSQADQLEDLQGIYNQERAKLLAPLMESYVKALTKAQKEALSSDDLTAASRLLKERTEILDSLRLLKASKAPKASPSDPVKETQKEILPSEVLSKGERISRNWVGNAGMKASKPWLHLMVFATVQGNSKGTVTLVAPGGESKEIYKWTGKEKSLAFVGNSIMDVEKEITPLVIDVDRHATEPGDYSVLFEMTEGDGRLFIYLTRMTFED